jgi:hypothetical protein
MNESQKCIKGWISTSPRCAQTCTGENQSTDDVQEFPTSEHSIYRLAPLLNFGLVTC